MNIVTNKTTNLFSKRYTQRGYTLMELLLYISLLGVLMLCISLFFVTIVQSRAKSQSILEVNQQATAIMDNITQTVRNAISINSPGAGASSGVLNLNVTTSALTPTIYKLDTSTTSNSAIMGYASQGVNTNDYLDTMICSKFTATLSGTLTSLNVYAGSVSASPNNNYRLAVYSNTGSGASARPLTLQTSSSFVATANSWNKAIISLAVVSGQPYWICGLAGNASTHIIVSSSQDNGATATMSRWLASTGGTFPGSYPGTDTGSNTSSLSVYGVIDGGASTGGFGFATAGTQSNNNGDTAICSKYIASATGTVTNLSVYLSAVSASPNNIYKLALYSNTGSGVNERPLNLLATNSITGFGASWYTTSVTPVSVTNGTTYWICGDTTAASTITPTSIGVGLGPTNQTRWLASTGGTFPSTWPGTDSGMNNDTLASYATIANGSAGTGPGNIQIKEGTGSYISLNSSDIEITNLTFNNLTRSGTPGTIQISFTANRKNPNGRNEYSYQKTFTSTATIRPGNTVTAPLPPSQIQINNTFNSASSPTLALAYLSSVTAGNLLVASVTWDTFSGETISCSDTLGNSYAVVHIWNDPNTTQGVSFCYAISSAAGANTITASFATAGATFRRMFVSEYSNIATVPLDTFTGVDADGTTLPAGVPKTLSTPNMTTTQDGDLILSAISDNDTATSVSAGPGFTQRGSIDSGMFTIEDRVQSSAGAIAGVHIMTPPTGQHSYTIGTVAFKAKIP